MREITHIILHCTATPAELDIGAADIRQWHLDRGWSDIGYHYIVRRNGAVEQGRPLERPGAHCREMNSHSIGVALVGGVAEDGRTPEDNFTQAQMLAARDLVQSLMGQHRVRLGGVMGHREVIEQITRGAPKACPVFGMEAFRCMLSGGPSPAEAAPHWGVEMADDETAVFGGEGR